MEAIENPGVDIKDDSDEVNKIIQACYSNAESFIEAAKLLKKPKMNHIIFHLAGLALEEVGKASLIASRFTVEHSLPSQKDINWGLDDHIKKLFWAFWGASFAKEKITKEQIEDYQGLARIIYQKRLDTLYTNPDLASPVVLPDQDVDDILGLAEARLNLNRNYGGINLDEPNIDKNKLKWFLESTEDPEKRKLIFGSKSLDKLVELGDSNKWIEWMFEQFEEANVEAQIKAINELTRKKPEDDEAGIAKWEMTFILQSDSHSIRASALNEWNQRLDPIKLGYKDSRNLTCKITLPKALLGPRVWSVGLERAQELIIALNIASAGFIFWQIPKDLDKFYEKIIDLEAGQEVIIAPKKKLQLDWQSQRLTLSKDVLDKALLVLGFLWQRRKEKKLHPILNSYYSGLTFLAKTDLHLRWR